jgi:hypothetical protein
MQARRVARTVPHGSIGGGSFASWYRLGLARIGSATVSASPAPRRARAARGARPRNRPAAASGTRRGTAPARSAAPRAGAGHAVPERLVEPPADGVGPGARSGRADAVRDGARDVGVVEQRGRTTRRNGIAPPTMAARESMASFALWEGCGGASVGSVGGCDCGGLAGQDVEERVTRRGLDDDAVRSDE